MKYSSFPACLAVWLACPSDFTMKYSSFPGLPGCMASLSLRLHHEVFQFSRLAWLYGKLVPQTSPCSIPVFQACLAVWLACPSDFTMKYHNFSGLSVCMVSLSLRLHHEVSQFSRLAWLYGQLVPQTSQ